MASELGIAITAATRLLVTIRQDVNSFLGCIAERLSPHGWSEAKTSGMNADFPRREYGVIYSKKGKNEPSDVFLILHISLDPPSPFEEPMVLMVIPRFDPPQTPQQVWDQWLFKGSHRVMRSTGLAPDPIELDPARLRPDFMPQATHAHIALIALCEFDGPSAVVERLVTPGLRICGELAELPST